MREVRGTSDQGQSRQRKVQEVLGFRHRGKWKVKVYIYSGVCQGRLHGYWFLVSAVFHVWLYEMYVYVWMCWNKFNRYLHIFHHHYHQTTHRYIHTTHHTNAQHTTHHTPHTVLLQNNWHKYLRVAIEMPSVVSRGCSSRHSSFVFLSDKIKETFICFSAYPMSPSWCSVLLSASESIYFASGNSLLC